MVGKLLTLGILISALTGCGTTQTYTSYSVKSSASTGYTTPNSSVTTIANLFQWKMYKLPHQDQVKQEQAVFFALDTLDEGEVTEWFGNNSSGKVSVMMSYPMGSGYCRVLFTQINYKGKTRNFKETACKNGSPNWQFVRK